MKSLFGLIAIFASSVCAAENRADFAYGAPLSVDQGASVYRATLTADVYRRAAYGDLRDLRVFNGDGEVVPFNLRGSVKATESRGATVSVPMFPLRGDATKALEALRVTITSDRGSIQIAAPSTAARSATVSGYLVDLRKQTEPIIALDVFWLDTAPEFSSFVTLAVSDDLSAWRTIASGAPIVNLQFAGQRLQQRRVEFSSVHAKFLRLDLTGGAEIPIDALKVEPAATLNEIGRLQAESIGRSPGSGDGYEFDLGLQAPIDRVNVRLPQLNSVIEATLLSRSNAQSQWRFVTRATFYRLQREGREIENQNIKIVTNADRFWKLTLDSKSALGDRVPRLRVEWVPAQVVFVARGDGPFGLSIGNNLAGRAETALDAFMTRGSSGADGSSDTRAQEIVPALARIGDFVEVGGPAKLSQSPPMNWKNGLLWSVLVLAVAILAFMARRLLREMGEKP